jgi:hypothetical protein
MISSRTQKTTPNPNQAQLRDTKTPFVHTRKSRQSAQTAKHSNASAIFADSYGICFLSTTVDCPAAGAGSIRLLI